MVKLRKIDINKVSYQNYRNWLSDIAQAKKMLLEKQRERIILIKEAQALREQLSQTQAKITKNRESEEMIRQEIIDVLPDNY